MAQISAPVGPQAPNRSTDVKTVQALLNRHAGLLRSFLPLPITGQYDDLTRNAIEAFQAWAFPKRPPNGSLRPQGLTIKTLSVNPPALPAPSPSARVKAQQKPSPGGLTEEQYVEIARVLDCEVPAIKAVVKTELGVRDAFDEQNRPTILYERHVFSRLTAKKYDKDKAHEDISNPVAGGYGKFSEQYPKLERAMKLNQGAALKSASWGAFQIMGENHVAAGHATVDDFVAAMKESLQKQIDAFISFISARNKLSTALQELDWASFAHSYNGAGYKTNKYDTKMEENYKEFAREK